MVAPGTVRHRVGVRNLATSAWTPNSACFVAVAPLPPSPPKLCRGASPQHCSVTASGLRTQMLTLKTSLGIGELLLGSSPALCRCSFFIHCRVVSTMLSMTVYTRKLCFKSCEHQHNVQACTCGDSPSVESTPSLSPSTLDTLWGDHQRVTEVGAYGVEHYS